MEDILFTIYPWVKALHVMAVIAWMAGMFYLPRLYVYHAEQVELNTATDTMFKTMEYRLLRMIINPAMGVAWICGILMALTPGVIDWSAVWPWTKLASILTLSWMHGWLSARRREFERGENTRTGRTYRLMNEVPTVLMVIIVISVIVRPF